MALAALGGGMSGDRTRTRERLEGDADVEVGGDREVDALGEREGHPVSDSTAQSGRLESLRERAGGLFSPRAFLAVLGATFVGLVAGTAVVPLPGAGLLGVFVATFLVGLVGDRRRYVTSTVAGAVTFGAAALFEYAVIAALGGLGAPLAAVAAVLGGAVGAVGHYFGRDLRDGLTREL